MGGPLQGNRHEGVLKHVTPQGSAKRSTIGGALAEVDSPHTLELEISSAIATGFVDEALARRGLQRHVALTVPGFMWALTVLAQTDLLGAVPRRLVEQHGRRTGLSAVEPPLPLRKDGVGIVTVKAAMSDPAMQWLVEQFESP